MFARTLKTRVSLIQRALYSTEAAPVKPLKEAGFKTNYPRPTEDVPNVEAFLNKIGRNSIEHVEHFPNWHTLFNTTSRQMKEKGIDVQPRRYILRMLDNYRNGRSIQEIKAGKKSFYGGEYKRREVKAKMHAEKRRERYAKLEADDAENRQQ